MTRLVWLLAPALAACSAPALSPPLVSAARPPACRAAPDGARLVADRGIGGTGAPPIQAPTVQAQSPQLPNPQPGFSVQMRSADRGIGGTGIVGVVTGFGSICLAGERVELPDDVPVRSDSRPSTSSALRTGQVAAVSAGRVAGDLTARAVDILHIVIGPVDGVMPGTMTVAGHQIDLVAATGPAVGAGPGAWVAVSGVRRPDRRIEATRVDPASPDLVTVRGELVRVYGATRIGSLPVRLPPGSALPAGWSAVVTGHIQAGVLVAESAAIDPTENPSDYFGPDTTTFLIEGYITAAPGGYLVSHLFVAAPGLDPNVPARRRVMAFERTPDGKLRASEDGPGGRGILNRTGSRQNRADPFPTSVPGSELVPRQPPPPDDARDRPGPGSRGRR